VMDFGIAKAQSGARLTGTGMSIGTPHYMSPEQARAQNLDGRSDVYSLGVVAYQALCGHVPFDGEDSFSIGYKHIMEELPVPPLESAEQRELFSVVQKMMAKKPDDRFQAADDVVRALETLGGMAGGSLSDMATMPTLAIEPMKAPPAGSTDKTTPLPRASGSMGKPAEAAAAPAAPARPGPPAKPAAPAVPPKGKPVPKPVPKRKSRVPYYALGTIAVVAVALGGYMVFGRGIGTQLAQQPAADTTQRQAPATPDTSKAQAPSDTTQRATPPTDTATPVRTAAPPPRTTPTRTNPPVRTTPPPTTVTPGAPGRERGTLRLDGPIPPNARITIDGNRARASEKLSIGRHTVRIEAPGFETFVSLVDVGRGVTRYPVTMVRASGAAVPAAATPQASPGAPAADCANPSVGVRNANNACYATRATPRTPAQVTPPASCTGTVSPATVLLRVTASGDVETASVQSRSSCAAFNDAAVAFARDLAFTPATKGGAPVAVWIQLLIRPAPR
jgi:TonB family protein